MSAPTTSLHHGRVPLYQVMVLTPTGDKPSVATDAEFAMYETPPVNPTRIVSCLGAGWDQQYDPAMRQLRRFTRAPEPGDWGPHTRVAIKNPGTSGWEGYDTEGEPLCWVYAADAKPGATDLATVSAQVFEGQDAGGFYFESTVERYPGTGTRWTSHAMSPQRPGVSFRVEAPRAIYVGFDPSTKAVSLVTRNGACPDPLDVSLGGGAPLLWLCNNGWAGGGAHDRHMTWSLAGVQFDGALGDPRVPAPSQFMTRVVSPTWIMIIDNTWLVDGEPDRESGYRVSVYDHADGNVYTIDPKVRNTTQPGSGAVPFKG